MIIPNAHLEAWGDLDNETMLDHGRLKAATLGATRRASEPEGFNTGLNLGGAPAGGSIEHLHTHVVPRWAGDTNFMPVVGETKVIVEGVDQTYRQLHAAFAADDAAVDPGDVDQGTAVQLSFD